MAFQDPGQSSPAAEGRKLFEYKWVVLRATMLARPPLSADAWIPSMAARSSSRTAEWSWQTTIYVRESILDPGAKIVKGFQNIMPSFRGRVSEEQLLQLLAYIKSLGNSKMSAVSEVPGTNYLNISHTVKSWLLTKDHKRIAVLYLIPLTLLL